MSGRVRQTLATGVAILFVLVIEAFALGDGVKGAAVAGGLAIAALALAAVRFDLDRIGKGCALLAAFTLTWNGWLLGPERPADVLILLALAAFFFSRSTAAFASPPWWVKLLAGAILLGLAVQILHPPSQSYLASRTVLDAGGRLLSDLSLNFVSTNAFVAFKFLVAIVAIPLVFGASARIDPRSVKRLATAFCTGSALSGFVAFLDYLGAGIGQVLTGQPTGAGARQLGFSDHPNFLAAGLVIAVPFAYALIFNRRRADRFFGIAAMLGLVLGTYASGSRGGAVCLLIAVVLCVALHPRTRIHVVWTVLACIGSAGLVVAAVPSFGAKLLRATRIVGDTSAAGSDQIRSVVGSQGVYDFLHAPIQGIGLQVSTEASQVYLQELASGGLILFIAMSLYMLGAISSALRIARGSGLAAAIAASLMTMVALNFVEADLTDRFYYAPPALLVAMLQVRRTHVADPTATPSADARRETVEGTLAGTSGV